jgi:hypothetical protein
VAKASIADSDTLWTGLTFGQSVGGCFATTRSSRLEEDSGQWRFSRRTVFHDHDYTLDGIGR